MTTPTKGLLRVARGLLEDLDVEDVLDRVLASAQELTGARYAALGVLDDSRLELSRFVTRGIEEDQRREIGALPRGRGVLGELIAEHVPLRLPDVSRHPRSYGFPTGHPPMRSFLGVPIMIGDEPYGNLYLTDKRDGTHFTDEDEEAVVLLSEFAGVAIDHARRFTGSEQQRADLQRTVDALDATLQIARALGGETDLAAILELVSKRGRALVSARAVVIELQVGNELVIAAAAGELPDDLVGRRVPLENTVASAALRARRTQRLSDELNRSRFEQYGLGTLRVEAQHALVVPLIFRNQSYGVLVAVDQLESGAFGLEHERLLEAFAASAATAVATAQSFAEGLRHQQLAAIEAERSRWARELHDETLQAMANLCLVLAGAERAGDLESMSGAIAAATEQLEGDIANLRALITDLRPAALDELGVGAALSALTDRLARSGLAIDLNVELSYESGGERPRLIPELETSVYRIVQEALTNARTHGGAERAVVEVVEKAETMTVSVRDDGRGFDVDAQHEGFGLVGMRERAELFGGHITVESTPGQGTSIVAKLPVQRVGGPRPFVEATALTRRASR